MIWLSIGIGFCCFGLGYLCSHIKTSTVGVLRLDHSDPNDRPYLFLELDHGGMEAILHNNTVKFRVRIENYVKS